MARNGVWELEKLLLRYCPTSGSSRGVREFVENGLVNFARKNPQIKMETLLRNGHPQLHGSYITGYQRQWCLKNLSSEEVSGRFWLMRNTLGRKAPKHSDISNRVVEVKRVSVQGVWRNMEQFDYDLPEEKEFKQTVTSEYNLPDVIEDIGLAGAVHLTEQLLEEQEENRLRAKAQVPKKYKVLPTE